MIDICKRCGIERKFHTPEVSLEDWWKEYPPGIDFEGGGPPLGRCDRFYEQDEKVDD